MSNRQYTIIVTILILLFNFVGCTKTTTTPISLNNAETTIQVFYSTPDKPYSELGLVTTQTGQTIFHDRSAEGMIEKLKVEAKKLGADAIIIRSADEGTWGLKGGGNTGFSRGKAQGIAIKFK